MKFFRTHVFIWGWLSILAVANAARILGIYPMPLKSRFIYGEAVMRSLFDAGHDITIVTPFAKEECLKNYTIVDSSGNVVFYVGQTSLDDAKNVDLISTIQSIGEQDRKCCENILELKEIQNILNSKDKLYDVMFIDTLYMSECYLPLAEHMGIPVIGTATFRSWRMIHPAFTVTTTSSGIGDSYHPAVVPFELAALSRSMTFLQRLRNTWYYVLSDIMRYFVINPKIQKIYQQYYPVHLWYRKQLSLMFYNNHPALLSRPLVPNAIEIGGVHVAPSKTLPQNIQKFIDESKHGVVLFSLGSVLKSSSMDPKLVRTFTDAFAAIPQKVIWKFEDEINDLPANVLTMSWLPQRDILAHKNVKAFVTHCGISGTYEAIYEGKPLIFTPLLWDQVTNGVILEELGVGVNLDLYSATKESVLNALNAVINDTRYRENMEELSRRFKDRPLSPQKMVVYWTEYVMRHHGATHLRTVAADMPFYQYLLLDVILSLVVVAFTLLYVMKFIFRYCSKKLDERGRVKEKTN